MNSVSDVTNPTSPSGRGVGLVLALAALLLGSVLGIHYWKGVPIGHLTCDPLANFEAPLYTGYLSQLGGLLWSACAAICLFTAQILPPNDRSVPFKKFLLASGLLTVLLCLDDVFLLHEEFFPYFGIPQLAILTGYGIVGLVYLVRCSAVVRTTDYTLLTLAVVSFAISLVLDVMQPGGLNPYFFEDGAKLLGILSWFGYFFRTAGQALRLANLGRESSVDFRR